MQYALAKIPAPLLNTPNFSSVFGGKDGSSLLFDTQGLVRAVEMVALPGSKFTLIAQESEYIWKVATKEYPHDPLYADIRFLERAEKKTPERAKKMPDKNRILETLLRLEGNSYVWGGNCLGIMEMLQFYPPKQTISPIARAHWTLKGVDCSGLLYLATDGSTPRNTGELVTFGKGLPIEGKSIEEMIELIEPLDLIVWKGHLIIAVDRKTVIESRADKMCVARSPLSTRLNEIISSMKRTPVNSWGDTPSSDLRFVINRAFT